MSAFKLEAKFCAIVLLDQIDKRWQEKLRKDLAPLWDPNHPRGKSILADVLKVIEEINKQTVAAQQAQSAFGNLGKAFASMASNPPLTNPVLSSLLSSLGAVNSTRSSPSSGAPANRWPHGVPTGPVGSRRPPSYPSYHGPSCDCPDCVFMRTNYNPSCGCQDCNSINRYYPSHMPSAITGSPCRCAACIHSNGSFHV